MNVCTYICTGIKNIHSMKKITFITVVAFAALLGSFQSQGQSTWTVDKGHSKLGFSITHLMVSDVEGSFKSFDAKITAPKDDFSNATVELKAETNSISTDNEKRDGHLKSPDFFDAEKFPSVMFKSTSFKKSGTNYKVKGELTMHGVTKPVELEAVCKMGTNPMSKKTIAGFKITGKVKRSDFGIGGSMPEAMLSEEVEITANAEFAKD